MDTPRSSAQRRSRTALDQRFTTWRQLPANGARPYGGWIRAIREALGMRAEDLARRMDVSQSSLTRLERSEKNGTARLDTLRRAADALECDIVYALVPRRPLEVMVQERARTQALARIGRTAHTMALEDQAVVDANVEERVQAMAQYLATRPGLWNDDGLAGDGLGGKEPSTDSGHAELADRG